MSSFNTVREMALKKAVEAMHKDLPDMARQWTEVAAVAEAMREQPSAATIPSRGVECSAAWQAGEGR